MKHAYVTPLTASYFLLHIDFDNVLTDTVSTTNNTSRGGEDSSHANTVFVLQFAVCCHQIDKTWY